MVFWGIFGGGKSDKDRFIESERRFEESRRQAYLAQKQQAGKSQPENQSVSNNDNKKKTREEKFREGFYSAEKKLNSAADKSAVVYRRIEKESSRINTRATKFSQAAEPFKITAAFDLDVTNDAKEYGRKAGLIHTGLDLFDISKGTAHEHGLDKAFGVGSSRKAKKGVKNDPLFDMYIGPSKGKKGKRKEEVRWF